MIQLLAEKLCSCENINDILWKSNNIEVYNKFSQYIHLDIVEEKKNIPIIKKDIVEEKKNIPIIKKYIVEEKIKLKKNTNVLFKPIEIILSETCTFNTNTLLVKQNIIDFISKQEFSKVFGMKKSAEIMTGIVNNKWNISTALFISFLFDKEVNYNNSKIIYNKEKNTGIILTLQSV